MVPPRPTEYLAEWFIRYTKNRDLIFKKISEIKQQENKIIVSQKDGKQVHYYVEPFPDDFPKLAEAMKEEHKGLIIYNSKENFDNMIKSWKQLSAIPNLTLYFVNPFSKIEKRWIINPNVHSKVSDAQSLKEGLNSMYIMVDPISKEEVEELTK
ncbi:hypothetical protein KY359_05580 [Candidatus Woesearchaeota archaeon]|nr:hypothetical protein [Candidatus Woesearchaeota archaeon]